MADGATAHQTANRELAQFAAGQQKRDAERQAANEAEAAKANPRRVRFVVHTSKKGNRSIKLVDGHGGPPVAHGLLVWRNLAELYDRGLLKAIEQFAEKHKIGSREGEPDGDSFSL